MSPFVALFGHAAMSELSLLSGVNRTSRLRPPTSEFDPGCVKTRSSQGCTELFSQLPSSDRSCQRNWFPHRRNRDGNSTRKLNVRVFTQPRSDSEVSAFGVKTASPPGTDIARPPRLVRFVPRAEVG